MERYDYVCVTLTLASPEEIRGLNAQYRQIDEPTDVLSFPMWENDRAFAPPEGWSDLPLGDVIVSPEQVSQNALEHNIDYNTEMALVVIHGILHLIGLDHDTEERRLQMWAEQEEVLKNYFKRVEVI
ncbi:MAG: rRNA maturation RNase YbeY [Synergistaceae bacterium]|nr:rRNA maturation RNase YbeY [Synergistaceae bacterium]